MILARKTATGSLQIIDGRQRVQYMIDAGYDYRAVPTDEPGLFRLIFFVSPSRARRRAKEQSDG